MSCLLDDRKSDLARNCRNNEASHDIYGISAETADANVEWLFVAIDQLIDDLHAKPQA